MVVYAIRVHEHGQMIERKSEDGSVWFIPEDEANTDYQAFLAWVAEGNEPEIIEP